MKKFVFAMVGLSLALSLDGVVLGAQRTNNVLSADEIARSKVTRAYDAVQQLRPRWLQTPRGSDLVPSAGTGSATSGGLPREFEGQRSTPSSNQSAGQFRIVVYVNEMSVGDVDYLKNVAARSVLEIRWLDTSEAANRFGLADGQTAIVVTLKPTH